MAVTLAFNLSSTARCNYLTVEDVSTFTLTSTRDDYGLALFVHNDLYDGAGFVEVLTMHDLTNPGTATALGTWERARSNITCTYRTNIYLCPDWVAPPTTYATNSIVYYVFSGTSGFWRWNAVLGNGTPGTDPNWVALTTSDYAAFEAASNVTKYSNQLVVVKCPDYQIVFDECPGVHRLLINTTICSGGYYIVYDIAGNIVVSQTYMTLGVLSYTITIPATNGITDGVYRLQIWCSNAKILVYEVPIYEWCSMKNCLLYMVDQLLCNEWDPCCDNCDNEAIRKAELQRLTLNEIMALYGTMMALIHTDQTNYLGVIGIDVTRLTEITRISQILSRIRDILIRCDLCRGAYDTSIYNKYKKPCNC